MVGESPVGFVKGECGVYGLLTLPYFANWMQYFTYCFSYVLLYILLNVYTYHRTVLYCTVGIMSFQKRKQWEGMFEDGVIVEGIETGEPPSQLLTEETEETAAMLGTTTPAMNTPLGEGESVTPILAEMAIDGSGSSSTAAAVNVVRKTDDVNTFLQTVDLAGVPQGRYSV